MGWHALCDAIYGALAAGDIGRHFPPSDPRWKGAASEVFLRHAAGLAAEGGWRLAHLDLTLICERPKVAPHAPAMIARTAEVAGLDAGARQRQGHHVRAPGLRRPGGGDRRDGHRDAAAPVTAARLLATVGGVGLLRPAPGTWGSARGDPRPPGSCTGSGASRSCSLATLAVIPAGVWAVGRMTRGAADHDPSEAVIDEVAGMWIALWPLSAGLWLAGAEPWVFPWPGWVGAFAAFRLLDIWKPGPVGWADRMSTPLGTVLDDVIAGAIAAVVVAALAALAHGVLL